MSHTLRSALPSFLPLTLLSLAVLGTVGCNMHMAAVPSTPTANTIQGRVLGGQQPVAGARIQLYAAGAPASGGGFGQGSTPLISEPLPTTNANGEFTITGRYSVPATPSYFYIVATGGSPGFGNPVNPDLVLMAAISDCTATASLSPSLFININEVTTIAAVSALRTFMAAPAIGNVGAPAIGAPSTAINDLRNAFKAASNLAAISTGAATDRNGPLINTLADILAYCVNSDPASTNNCSTLFTDATPSDATPLAADTIQAAWYIAQNPTNEVAALFALVPPSPPFVALTSAPPDFNVSVPPTAGVACFAVLGASTVTNTGLTVVSRGDLGLFPGTSVTGFPPGTITAPAAQHINDAIAANAQNNLIAAYNYAAGLSGATALPAELGGLALTPGLYSTGTAQISSDMTLDAQGDRNAVFIFQIGSTLTTAASTHVVLANGAQAKNVFWQVGSSATLGASSRFEGTIMANASITVGSGVTIEGRAMAITAAVTLDTDIVTAP